MIVSDNTIQAECLGVFFKKLGKKGFIISKKIAKNVITNPGRPLEITSNIATAAASRNTEATLSTLPEVINFFQTGKGLYLGKFV